MLRRADVRRWEARIWIRFFAIGLSFCVLGNGAVHLGLNHIPATMGSFLMNMVPLLVLLGGLLWLRETPTPQQVMGIVVSLAGSTLFFAPGLKAGEVRGIAIFGVGLVGIASYGILGREIARDRWVDTLSLTAVPMVFGGGILLAIAFAVEGLPQISASVWSLMLWLAIVNTACVLILYNRALRSLKAFEMSVILSLSPVVTAFWAWTLLDERLAVIQLLGMVTMILGVVLVQWRRKNS